MFFYENVNYQNMSDLMSKMNIAKPGINLADISSLMRPKPLLEFNPSAVTAASPSAINPMSILSIISMLNGNGGLGSASSLVSTLTPLISLLPINQYFPGMDQQTSSTLIASLPQLIKLVETFSNFHLLVRNSIFLHLSKKNISKIFCSFFKRIQAAIINPKNGKRL